MVSVTGIIQLTALMSFSAEAMSSSLRWVPSGKVIVEQPLVPEVTRKSTSIDARSNLSAWWGRGRGMILDILDILDITFGPFFSFLPLIIFCYFLPSLPFSSFFFSILPIIPHISLWFKVVM